MDFGDISELCAYLSKGLCFTWACVCIQGCVPCRSNCIAVVQRLCFHLKEKEKVSIRVKQ